MRSVIKVCSVLFMLGVLTFSVCAGSWLASGAKRRPETLIVTGNYKSPRLIAELIQTESRQSYLLLPAAETGDSKIIWLPPKGGAGYEMTPETLGSRLKQLSPRRIIILGDERYVSSSYVELFRNEIGNIPFMRIEGKSWELIADELTFMLNLNNLGSNFRKLNPEMRNPNRIGGTYNQEDTAEESPAESAAEEIPVTE